VRSFLGHDGFYRKFIKDFCKLARPLIPLLYKEIKFDFTEECHDAFHQIKQALISAGIGYTAGMLISLFVVNVSKGGGAAILLPWQMGAGMFLLTMLMCTVASMVSINKVTRIDPAMVFKG